MAQGRFHLCYNKRFTRLFFLRLNYCRHCTKLQWKLSYHGNPDLQNTFSSEDFLTRASLINLWPGDPDIWTSAEEWAEHQSVHLHVAAQPQRVGRTSLKVVNTLVADSRCEKMCLVARTSFTNQFMLTSSCWSMASMNDFSPRLLLASFLSLFLTNSNSVCGCFPLYQTVETTDYTEEAVFRQSFLTLPHSHLFFSREVLTKCTRLPPSSPLSPALIPVLSGEISRTRVFKPGCVTGLLAG